MAWKPWAAVARWRGSGTADRGAPALAGGRVRPLWHRGPRAGPSHGAAAACTGKARAASVVAPSLARMSSKRGAMHGRAARRASRGHSVGPGRWEAQPRPSRPEPREERAAMEVPRRRRKREVRKTMNGHGLAKMMARRCRGRRDLPRGGGGRRWNTTVWPEKLAEELAGNLAFPNFGVRSAVIGVADRETGCTSGILASRATPAYIYIRRVCRFWKVEIF